METNKFLSAIERDELADFSIGKGKYFIADPEYGEHWVLGAWLYHIIPAIEQDKDLEKYILELINALIDENSFSVDKKIEYLLYHVYVFYYLLSEKRIKTVDIIKDLEFKVHSEIVKARIYYRSVEEESAIRQLDSTVKLIKAKGGFAELSI